MSRSPQAVLGIRAGQIREMLTQPFSGRCFLSLSVAAFFVMAVPLARADVIGEGDVSPSGPTDLPIAGGTATADVIVGDTGIGRLTIDVPAFTDPLVSVNGIIGNTPTGIGEATVSGFASDQSEWRVESVLTVASEGQGFLNITGGGKVSVTGDGTAAPPTVGEIFVGDLPFSQGFVTVDGFASTLETVDFILADEGLGTVEIRNRGQLRTDTIAIGFDVGSIGRLTLTGQGTRWTNTGDSNNDLIIGEEGRATLEILDGAFATTAGDVLISNDVGSRGVVRVSGPGTLWQIGDDTGTDNLEIGVLESGELHVDDGGLVRVDDAIMASNTNSLIELDGGTIHATSLDSNGVVRGDGRIESVVTISPSGEIRNAALVANLREKLLVTGTVTNNGTIESLGGEMEFESAVTNNLEIIARDAVIRFSGGLTNNGTISLGGETILHGPITGPGNILVLTGSESEIAGDLTFSGGTLTLAVGDAPGTLDVSGMADLGSTLLLLDYSAGVGAQAGDSYDIFSAGGGLGGSTFLNPTAIADGLIWDISYSSTTVTATAMSLAVIIGPDFNGDGIVDGIDLAIWQANAFILSGALPEQGDSDLDGDVDGADFLRIQRQFGMAPTPLVPASTAVPEPSAILLLIVGAIGLISATSHRGFRFHG